jgi:hypothetical protein
MVTIEQLGNIGEILGAIATVGMLVYLSFQIREGTTVNKTSTLAEMLEGARDRTAGILCLNAEVSDIVARGVNSLESLDEKEKVRFCFFVMEQVLHMQNVMERHNAKLLPKVDYVAWLDWTGVILRTPGGRAIWPQVRSVITPTIGGVLDEHLEQNQDSPTLLDLMPVFVRSAD